MSPARVLLAAAVVVGTLSACAGTPEAATAPTAAASHRGPTVPAPSSAPNGWASTPSEPPTGAPTGAPMDDHGDDEPTTTTTVDPEAVTDAEGRATAFLRAFARTDLPQEDWWTGVEGYFTPQARAIYASTDVANVPLAAVVEDSARFLEAASTPYRAQVSVETDAGAYVVVLVRADGDWLVERATPPA